MILLNTTIDKSALEIIILVAPIAIALISLIVSSVIGVRNSQLTTEVEKLKTENEKELHIHKAQYDKEYQIYEEVWEVVFKLSQSIPALRPIFEEVPIGISNDEHLKTKLGAAINQFNTFLHRVESNKPFYAPTVYEVLKKMKDLMRKEINQVQIFHKRQDEKYFEAGEKNTLEFISLSDELCEAIRKRTSHSTK